MSHGNLFGYTSNRCTFDRQYFYYFNRYPMISSGNKIGRRWFLGLFEFVHGLTKSYSRYKLLLAASSSIPNLISDVHKLPQTLHLVFLVQIQIFLMEFIFAVGSDYFYGILTIVSLNSLVDSNWGVLLHQHIMTRECFFRESLFTVTPVRFTH